LISEPEGLSEPPDCAWRDDDGKSLSDFGPQSGSNNCRGLKMTNVDAVDDICGDLSRRV
jgi:hypothetical protein